MACERITAGITAQLRRRAPDQGGARSLQPDRLHDPRPLQHLEDGPLGDRRADRCHVNWVILDSDWEAEFCRVAEVAPAGCAPTSRTTTSGFEVPYRYGSETRKYLPDFIVLVDDGHGDDDLLHLVVEIKGYRREDAKEKKSTMDTYWVPGVNHLGTYGRWAFAEFTRGLRDRVRLRGEGRRRVQQDDRPGRRRDRHSDDARDATPHLRQQRAEGVRAAAPRLEGVPARRRRPAPLHRRGLPVRGAARQRSPRGARLPRTR